MLDEYRVKCEAELNYDEAGRAAEQLATIRKQEETRRVRAIQGRHDSERGALLEAHRGQVDEFNAAWARYLAEFDAMAAMYTSQMQERHAVRFKEFQDALHDELMHKPVKFSRELLEWRSREQTLAKCVPVCLCVSVRAI